MKVLTIAAVFILACGVALAQHVPPPVGEAPGSPSIAPPDEEPPYGGGPGTPAAIDADRDLFRVTLDCNDNDPAVKPGAVEIANGVDDDCNGVVDDGFDTTIDWPKIQLATNLWPVPTAMRADEVLSSEAQPRLVWAGDRFLAAWVDVRSRLRLAQIKPDGTLYATPSYLRKPVRSLDVAWTGTHLGIVYENTLMGASSVWLMLVDREGLVLDDVLLAAAGTEPKIAWGQDRFGVVWKDPGMGISSMRFQRFDLAGRPLAPEEIIEKGGSNAAIAFSGTSVIPLGDGRFDVREGWFGIVYEPYYAFAATGDVFLVAMPRESGNLPPIGPVQVNQHQGSVTSLGAKPAIAANPAGFAVAWHAVEKETDVAQARFFSLQGLAAVQEFTPDADLGRYGRMAWTGSEFVMVNDNRSETMASQLDVHFRRVDPSGNTHLAAGWGPWNELRLRDAVPGYLSTYPDVAISGGTLGVAWVEAEPSDPNGGGRLWFAIVTHK